MEDSEIEGGENSIEIIAQCQGLKTLSIEGGWRFSLDLFEVRVEDIKSIVHLVNKKANVKVALEEYEHE